MRRTPARSQRTCPGAADKACKALRRWPDAIAKRKTVLIVTSLSEASARGSKGALASASKTRGRLHDGSNLLVGGRSKKKARTRPVKEGAVVILDPSPKPAWTTAKAER